ncbi:MAG: signal peptidase II [Enterococcus sp.]
MFIIYLVISSAIVAIDQLVKWGVVQNLALGESQSVIDQFFSLTYIKNTGAAWSILEGRMIFFYIITLIAVIGCLIMLYKNLQGSKFLTYGLTFIIAGALGNFIDRLRLGYVVDMFQTDFINFPIFNVADMALCIGVALVFIYAIIDEKKEQ